MEKRQAQRFPLSEKVHYEPSVHETSMQTVRIEAQIQNVSAGGLCLLTKEALKTAQVIKIALPLPSVEASTPTLTEVRWVREDSGKGVYQAGLRFLLSDLKKW